MWFLIEPQGKSHFSLQGNRWSEAKQEKKYKVQRPRIKNKTIQEVNNNFECNSVCLIYKIKIIQ
jgi:hypothetical protein